MSKKSAVTAVRWLPIRAVMGLNTPAAMNAANSSDDEDVPREPTQTLPLQPQSAPTLKSGDKKKKMTVEEEFDMDNYDNEDDEVAGLNYFTHVDADLKLNSIRDSAQNYDEASDSEDEDFYTVKQTDLMFVAANAEEEQCYVDVYVYDQKSYGMFVRQNFDLNSYPLSMEFISSFKEKDDACIIAVSTFDKAIELWDLHDLCANEPVGYLGLPSHKSKASKKKSKGKAAIAATQSHSDAVICMHVCPTSRHVLATGSADNTIRIWDLRTLRSIQTITHHKDKVQAIQWHPTEGGVLVSAAYDKTVVVCDVRAPDAAKKVKLTADPEWVVWVPQQDASSFSFVVSDEEGHVSCYDVRNMQIIWKLQAHTDACTSVAFSGVNTMITSGTDGSCRVWSMNGSSVPSMVREKAMGTGPIFSVANIADSPDFVAFGGAEAGIWNIKNEDVHGDTGKDQDEDDDEDDEMSDELEDEDEEMQEDDEEDD